MKRYSLGVDWNSAGRPEPCAKEMSAGRFILFDDHAALLRAVADEVKKLPKRHDYESYVVWRLDFDEAVGKVLAMLEVE